jgi:gamma-glutamyltranspeptidase
MAQVHRPILMTEHGAVVAGHHRAAEAGAAVLRRGGNAFDAAVTTAATLCVAIPNMNGLGGDAFALLYDARSGQVTAVNGSGAAPRRATVAAYRERGLESIPERGPLSISVPGMVHAWGTVLGRFGTIGLQEALQPAIALAEEGVPTDLVLQRYFAGPGYQTLAHDFPDLAAIYGAPGLRRLGERLSQPALARSFRILAAEGAAALYRGELGRALLADLERAGSVLSPDDLAAHDTLLSASLQVGYRERAVHVAPPNSQGVALAAMLGLWAAMAPKGGFAPSAADYLRLRQIAFRLRDRHVADPKRADLPAGLLHPETLAELLQSAPGFTATEARAGGGDTSTLVVIDRWGNAVSWVQSLFEDFGSGVVSPETGIVMHNRLYLEQLNADPIRGLLPGMRPFHTLCPALVVGDGCEMAIATPGDHGQPQAIFQVLTRFYDAGCNLQEAIELPRMRHDTGLRVMIEDRAPADWADTITGLGLQADKVGPWSRLMGGVNAIARQPDGLLFAAADPRRASYAVCA